MNRTITCACLLLIWSLPALAQQTATVGSNSVVPPLVNFSGVLRDLNGKALTGPVGVTFALYKDSESGAPLWVETQTVQADKTGRYSVELGAAGSQGLPLELFVSGEARWLGVQAQGWAEQPRILLLSVPYALKAGDAQTVGGLPPSAFVLTSPLSSPNSGGSASSSVFGSALPARTVTGSGTTDFLPLWTSSSNIANSVLFQSGTGSKARIGINTTKPGATLDVKGGTNIEGVFNLPATGTATAKSGENSQPQDFVASSYNSRTKAAVNQTFQWQAEPFGNDTPTPSGALHLLFGSGTSLPAETGLRLDDHGLFTFAAGQTFPGTGTITGIKTATGSGLTGGGTKGTLSLSVSAAGISNTMLLHPSLTVAAGGGMTGGGSVALGGTTTLGLKSCKDGQILRFVSGAWVCADASTGTVSKVDSGAGLTGGPIITTGTLSIASGGVANAMLAHPSLTVTAGTDLTGGGLVTLGGTTTLNLDTTKVPQLNANNSFSGNQSVTGNLGVMGSVSAHASHFTGNTENQIVTVTQTGSGSGLTASTSGAPAAVLGTTTNTSNRQSAGVSGVATGSSGVGVLGRSLAKSGTPAAVEGVAAAGYGVYGHNTATDEFNPGVIGVTASISSPGVIGEARATAGSNVGTEGLSLSSAGTGVLGFASSSLGFTLGVNGISFSTVGVGVLGQAPSKALSQTAASVQGSYSPGVWGDTTASPRGGAGIIGSADDNWGMIAINNSVGASAIHGENNTATTTALVFDTIGGAVGGSCTIDVSGNLNCSGTIGADAPVDGGTRKVSLYGVQSAENWFEDAGSGQLHEGSAHIALDPTFAQTVNTAVGYHVFLTPNGDCKGLYVDQKTATSFEVHETGGGSSSIAFDYRIMAKRSGFEEVRLADDTEKYRQFGRERALQDQSRKKPLPQ